MNKKARQNLRAVARHLVKSELIAARKPPTSNFFVKHARPYTTAYCVIHIQECPIVGWGQAFCRPGEVYSGKEGGQRAVGYCKSMMVDKVYALLRSGRILKEEEDDATAF